MFACLRFLCAHVCILVFVCVCMFEVFFCVCVCVFALVFFCVVGCKKLSGVTAFVCFFL